MKRPHPRKPKPDFYGVGIRPEVLRLQRQWNSLFNMSLEMILAYYRSFGRRTRQWHVPNM